MTNYLPLLGLPCEEVNMFGLFTIQETLKEHSWKRLLEGMAFFSALNAVSSWLPQKAIGKDILKTKTPSASPLQKTISLFCSKTNL